MADLTGPNPDEVNGLDAHDAPVTAKPVLGGAYASAAAPSAVSADGDAVNLWALRSGALATVLTAAGALIGGDAANGLDVDVTRLPALVAGTANIGDVDVLTVPADPFGANADAASATGSISAKLRFIAATGIPITGTVTVASHAVTNAGVFAVQDSEKIVDNAGFTDGTSKVMPSGYIFDEVAGTALTENDAAAARIDSKRAQVFVIEDATTRGTRANVATTTDNLALGSGLNVNAVNLVYDGTNTDMARSIAALDAAPNTDVGIMAVGVGPGWDRKLNPAGVAATSTANAVTVVVDGADTISFHVTTIGTTPGSMIIETTADDSNWATAGAVLKLGAETWVNGSFVPAVNDVYMVRTTGVRQVRYRVNATYASGTATVKVTGAVGAAIVKAIDVGPAPHSMGYTILTAQVRVTSTQTSANLVAGTAGKRIYVVGYEIGTGGTTAVRVSLYWGTGAFTAGTSPTLFDAEFAPSVTQRPGAIQSFPWAPGGSSATGDNLRITTDAAGTVMVIVHYYVA